MRTRQVLLTDRHAGMIDTLVESGRYRDADEVLREGLRLIEVREAADAAKLEALRAAAQVGIDDVENGRYKEFADADALVAYLTEITKETVKGAKDR